MRMAEYEIKKVEAEARAEAFRGQPREELLVSADGRQEAPLKKSGR